jgi:hypothetical protein
MDALMLLRIVALSSGISLARLAAQEASPSPAQLRGDIWRAELSGGEYMVRLSAITSVSLHEYVLDGVARVVEVNIATSGSELARFYYVEPYPPGSPVAAGRRALNAIENKAQETSARIDAGPLQTKVVKNYPVTTHAHTVEYRLSDRDAVNKLFKSVEEAWLNGRSGSFKP